MGQVLHGDCLDMMATLPDNSVDAVVTDAPYGLSQHSTEEVQACLLAWCQGKSYEPKGTGFMNRAWDAWVPGPEVWREVLRVLKPGGHALVFAGTRSMDLMSMALRLAGFELRDSIGYAHDGGGAPLAAWVYGSGFPKSLDVSKAIDKMKGRLNSGESVIALKATLIDLFNASGKTRQTIDAECGFRAANYLTLPAEGKRPDPWVNVLPSQEKWAIIKRVLGCDEDISSRLDALFEEAEREVIGQDTKARSTSGSFALPTLDGETVYRTWNLTAPATPEAQQWEGWGTSLKPAWEPILLCRKPLTGTVAQNVLEHGTGGLNIAATRVGTDEHEVGRFGRGECSSNALGKNLMGTESRQTTAGRWPANLIHDGSDQVLAGFPDSRSTATPRNRQPRADKTQYRVGGDYKTAEYGDSGSAARFFYCAKPSKRERGEFNTHPTVKPLALFQYLVRLVTPPGGLVLDPFAGSGTTGLACLAEGFDYILIEMEEESVEIAKRRIALAHPDEIGIEVETEHPSDTPSTSAQLTLFDQPA